MKPRKPIFARLLPGAIGALSAYAAEETADATPAAPIVLDTSPAMQVAERWLAYIDSGRYAESWDDSAAFFREAVNKVQWETTLAKPRGRLGMALSRKRGSATDT